MRKPPRVHFSFRSPFSWLALHRLAELVPDVHERVEFLPYWDPDPWTDQALRERGSGTHYVQMSAAKHRYILQDTRRQASRLGLSMAWPIDDEPWWEVPHLAWLLARRKGHEQLLYQAVVRARWERGENVCEPGTLRRVADQAGLDGVELAAATEQPDVRREGVDCMAAAYDDDIFGIPYFRIGPHRFWGLDRVDDFAAALCAAPATTPVPVPRAGAYDRDTAGGCG
jgi:2-hydroxychromene-2-carboxylate isomerase